MKNWATLKSKACLKCLYFTIIIFDLCRYLEHFSLSDNEPLDIDSSLSKVESILTHLYINHQGKKE